MPVMENEMNTGMGYGLNNGIGGAGGGLLGIILGGALFGNGFGNNNNGNVSGFQQGVAAGQSAKYSDVVDSTQSILASNNSGFDRVANVARSGAEQNLMAISGVKDSVQNGDFANALLFKDLDKTLCQQNSLIISENAKTRDLITSNLLDEKTALNTRLENELNLIRTGNFPITTPGHVDKWNGHNVPGQDQIAINNVNQNVNALGSTVTQLASVVQNLESKMGK